MASFKFVGALFIAAASAVQVETEGCCDPARAKNYRCGYWPGALDLDDSLDCKCAAGPIWGPCDVEKTCAKCDGVDRPYDSYIDDHCCNKLNIGGRCGYDVCNIFDRNKYCASDRFSYPTGYRNSVCRLNRGWFSTGDWYKRGGELADADSCCYQKQPACCFPSYPKCNRKNTWVCGW